MSAGSHIKNASMRPLSTVAPRRVPQQTRGQKRVIALLGAASEVLAKKGYEAATMSEIAERAHAAIGSLYQFFPNKESVAFALHTQIGQDLEKLWVPVFARGDTLTLQQALDRVIELTVHYIDTHPVVVALLQAPRSTWNGVIRSRLEQRIATFFMSAKPGLPRANAKIFGAVCMQIIKSCSEQYLQTKKPKRNRLVCEYKLLLYCYADGASQVRQHATRRCH
jgi:AcrR family transcriptional regulator